MANCNSCLHRDHIGNGELRCRIHEVSISSYSWCGQHEDAYTYQVALDAKEKASQRITDNPRSAEDIHD